MHEPARARRRLPAQKHNEEKLNEAFRQKCGTFLIFSVNMSGHFQGYARMMSYVQRDQVRGPVLETLSHS
jgi:hypothetical protein